MKFSQRKFYSFGSFAIYFWRFFFPSFSMANSSSWSRDLNFNEKRWIEIVSWSSLKYLQMNGNKEYRIFPFLFIHPTMPNWRVYPRYVLLHCWEDSGDKKLNNFFLQWYNRVQLNIRKYIYLITNRENQKIKAQFFLGKCVCCKSYWYQLIFQQHLWKP